MNIEYDAKKNQWNIDNRGLSFDSALHLDWDNALIKEDIRKNYTEKRFVASALLEERVFIVCFTPINKGIRIISFRKANKREVKHYETALNR